MSEAAGAISLDSGLTLERGEHSYIHDRQIRNPSGALTHIAIGRFCSIATDLTIIGYDHHPEWITTYPFLDDALRAEWPGTNGIPYPQEARFGSNKSRGGISIGNDVWIGYNVRLFQGVTIGNGAVIGACSLVNKSVEPYTIVAGIPARPIRKRFTDKEIAILERSRWWNWTPKTINRYLPVLCSSRISELERLLDQDEDLASCVANRHSAANRKNHDASAQVAFPPLFNQRVETSRKPAGNGASAVSTGASLALPSVPNGSAGHPARVFAGGARTESKLPSAPANAAPKPAPAPPGQNPAAALQAFHQNATDYFADVVPPALPDTHLRNSRVVSNRDQILPLMPKGGICAELGTQTGGFAKLILSILQPARLHIFDFDYTVFDHNFFEPLVQRGGVQLHKGDSSTLLATLPDRHFDFIYIDGDHSYEGVVRDLEQSVRKIKDDGWIVCNDYTIYSPLEKIKYGVYRAVNEFCLRHRFEIVFLGLQCWGYHDVALRKMRAENRTNGSSSQNEIQTKLASGAETQANTGQPASGPACGSPPLRPGSTVAPSKPAGTEAKSQPDAETEAHIRRLARYVGDDWKQQPYYDDAEQYMEKQWKELIWPIIREADFGSVLDLAAGHGRNSEKLRQHATKIYVVDINQENIDFCQRRFSGDSRFVYLRNDGCSLSAIPAGHISLGYCFDAMVHFDSDVVRAYLREFQRVLRPGGLGFCHHSNHAKNPGGDVHDNPGWRNFMSQDLFAHYCAKEGLHVLKSRIIDWTGPQSDCVTLFRKP